MVALLAWVLAWMLSQLAAQTDAGRDLRWRLQMGGAGASGTATATSATTLTDSGASWGTTQFVGGRVWAAGNRYMNILSHTATVLTGDQWYDPANSSSGAVASTPSGTAVYGIDPGGGPIAFMALSTDSGAVVNGDTTMPSEITTASGGLIAKAATMAHGAGATTGTATATYTVNGSDTIPANVQKVGMSQSIKSTWKKVIQALITSANMAAIGDQISPTGTFTL